MAKAVNTKSKKVAKKSPARLGRAKDLPATYGALYEFRSELKSDIAGVRSEMKSGFKAVEAKFKDVDARFNQVDARFDKMEARFDRMDAQLHKMNSELQKMNADMSRMLALHEEQDGRNKVSFERAEEVGTSAR